MMENLTNLTKLFTFKSLKLIIVNFNLILIDFSKKLLEIRILRSYILHALHFFSDHPI